jgi:hypothetical protein
MSSYTNDSTFNSMGRLGMDPTDSTQQNLQNTRFANYTLSSFFSENLSDTHIKFATQQPAMMISGTANGKGIIGSAIDIDSELMHNSENERSMSKLQLMQRPFITVPYLGRGSCDPTLESQMMQGERMSEKKSIKTVMDKSFMGYSMYPTDSNMEERVSDSKHTIEESALNGWVRGGASSREVAQGSDFSRNSRPSNTSF